MQVYRWAGATRCGSTFDRADGGSVRSVTSAESPREEIDWTCRRRCGQAARRASAVHRVPAELPAEPVSSTSTSPTAAATDRVEELRAPTGDRADPRLPPAGDGTGSSRPRPTTTAGSCSSAPMGCSTSLRGTAARDSRPTRRTSNPYSAKCSVSTRGRRARWATRFPPGNPFVGDPMARDEICGVWPPQPVPLLLRPADRRPGNRRRRAGNEPRRSTSCPPRKEPGAGRTSAGIRARAAS